jgi:hypothetical protein
LRIRKLTSLQVEGNSNNVEDFGSIFENLDGKVENEVSGDADVFLV